MMFNRLMRRFKFLLIKLFRIKGNAHKISLGFTLGFLVNFIPSFGIGPVISIAGAKLFKGNPVAGFIGGVSVIWLFPFMFYLNIVVGEMFFPSHPFPYAAGMMDGGMHVGAAFILGMIVNILLFGMIIYFSLYKMIQNHRMGLLSFIRRWDVKK